jgi:ketosteroid isomerase-like protein
MRRVSAVLGTVVVVSAVVAVPLRSAGTNTAAEAAIRKIVAAENDGKTAPEMADMIAWTGPMQRPVIGKERPVPAATAQIPLADRVSAKTVRTPTRIIVADSGDLAYEYETGVVTATLKDGSTKTVEVAAIRVWQKDGGEWKLAAHFSAPFRK